MHASKRGSTRKTPGSERRQTMAKGLAKLVGMTEVGVHKAKTELSKLIKRVQMGEEIIITSNGNPVAKLVPVEARRERVFGMDEGLFEVPDDFDDPLPDEILELFEG